MKNRESGTSFVSIFGTISLIAVICFLAWGFLRGFEYKEEITVMQKALKHFSELRHEKDGKKASQLKFDIVLTLKKADLSINDIYVGGDELNYLIRKAYVRQAKKDLAWFDVCKANPSYATKLRDRILEAEQVSGRVFKELGVSEDYLNRLVVKNAMELAVKQGVSPADLKKYCRKE